jgi:hypothetical protein
MFYVPSIGTFEYDDTHIYKQNSALLRYYESGSQRLLCVPGVGVLYLFQLPTPNFSCGPKN